MITAHPMQTINPKSFAANPVRLRHAVKSKEHTIFESFSQEEIKITIWQRELSASLQNSIQNFLALNPNFEMEMTVTPQNVLARLSDVLGDTEQAELSADIDKLVDRFCTVFELKRVVLNLKALGQTMCPKFHFDRVPCRLLTTYQGVGTEWLPHEVVDRTKLGKGSHGLSDSQSGLFQSSSDIQQLSCGDVALLKGELWEGNKNAGLVHRSPNPPIGEYRLLLKLDFIDSFQ